MNRIVVSSITLGKKIVTHCIIEVLYRLKYVCTYIGLSHK